MTLYRDFDQAALDAQYNCRAMVPDMERWIARWAEDSRAAVERLDCRLDIAYGPSPAERLDIFPADGPGAPIMVFIHGGYWRSMDKDVHRFMAQAFVAAGVALVTINYALAPAVRMDEIVRQNRAALAWVYRHAPEFGADRDRIHVAGHSAGGHLTALMMATDWPGFSDDLPSDLVKGGCPISGLYDLEPIRLSYLNDEVRLDPGDVERYSPARLSPRGAGWMVITAGGLESDEFHRLQAELVDTWRAAGLDVSTVASPGLHHFNVVMEIGRADGRLFDAVRQRILGRSNIAGGRA